MTDFEEGELVKIISEWEFKGDIWKIIEIEYYHDNWNHYYSYCLDVDWLRVLFCKTDLEKIN